MPEHKPRQTHGAIVEQTVHFGYCHLCDWHCCKESWAAVDALLDDHLSESHDVESEAQHVI